MHPPPQLLPWLTCTTSLTEKLRTKSAQVRLQVLSHVWEDADNWDREVLHLAAGRVIHREIVMHADDVPCWYARTILPEKTVLAHQTLFERLQTEPLGHLIFESGCIKRVSLQYDAIEAFLSKYKPMYAPIFWRRLSTFALIATDDPFYLVEIFLPGLEQYW